MLKKVFFLLINFFLLVNLVQAQTETNQPLIYTCYNNSRGLNVIKIIDAMTLEEKARIPIGAGTFPEIVEISSDKKIAFVGHDIIFTTGMSIVNLIEQRVIKTMFDGIKVRELSIGPDKFLYALLETKEIRLVNQQSFNVERTIALPQIPRSITFNPNGQRAYVVLQNSVTDTGLTLISIDLKTFSIINSLGLPSGFPKEDGVTISPNGQFLYIPVDGLVTVVNTNTLTLQGSLPGSNLTYTTEISPDGNTLYVLDLSTFELNVNPFLMIVDIPSGRMVNKIFLETRSRSMKISQDGKLLYIMGLQDNLYVISTATNTVLFRRPHNENAFTEDVDLTGDFTLGTPPTVQVTAPQVNEVVQQGQPFTIRWQTTSGGFKPIKHKVELFSQGDSRLERVLADNLSGDTQELQWNVPAIPMTDLQIRITATDLAARTTSVLSGVFSIGDKPVMGDQQAPMVRFTNPLGGERFTTGDNLLVNWVSSDNVGITSQDLALSTDGGVTFPLTLANGLAGTTQSFNFTIPSSLQTTQGRLRLIVRDGAGNSAQSITPMDFQIQAPPDRQAPVVTISSPMVGAMIGAGESIVVNWQSVDNVSVVSQALLLSTNGGGSFQTIMSFAGGIGTFTLNGGSSGLDKVNSNVQVKITAMDGAGNQGEQVTSFVVRPMIMQSVYNRPILTISGLGFTANGQTTVRVLVNGLEVATNKIALNGNNSITVQGNKKKLKLVNGENNVQVIVNNIASNTAKFQFMP